MKKIGILSHYHQSQNIGGLLQAYALPAFLELRGFKAEQIDYDWNALSKKEKIRVLLQRVRKFSVCKLFKKLRNLSTPKHLPAALHILQAQRKKFFDFAQQINHSPNFYINQTLLHANEKYDIFISGSDQVWANYTLFSSGFFCTFAQDTKKCIAYAASSNVKQFEPNEQVLFIQHLRPFSHISVREKTLKEYIERITPYKATVVLDPTFLLSPQDWLKIANQKVVPQKPYIFCYFLGEKSAWQRKTAQEYADKYGYQVVHLPYIMRTIRPADKYLKGQGRYDVGPREFIALINNAQCVFTDSFHGLAFSINFGKNFYVFNRDDASGPRSMNARITDTLETFGLTKRHITDKNAKLDNKRIDFTNAHKILEQEKQNSINWLLNALKD